MADTKRCPYCGEEILANAKKCKHCKEWLEDRHVNNMSENVTSQMQTKSKKDYWPYVVGGLIVVCIIACIAFYKDSPAPTEEQPSTFFNNLSTPFESKEEEVDENDDGVDEDIVDVQCLLANSNYVKYTNARFGFSIIYPDCFEMGEESQNGDGCEFFLKHNISFSVYGCYNDELFYGEDIKDYYLKDEDMAKSSYHIQIDNWFVMSGNFDEENIFYKKVVLMKDYTDRGSYVTFYLHFPKKFNKVLDDFINYEAKNFNPKYEGKHNQEYSQNIQNIEIVDPLKELQIQVQPQSNEDIENNNRTLLGLMLAAAVLNQGFRSGDNNGVDYNGLHFNNEADVEDYKNAQGLK